MAFLNNRIPMSIPMAIERRPTTPPPGKRAVLPSLPDLDDLASHLASQGIGGDPSGASDAAATAPAPALAPTPQGGLLARILKQGSAAPVDASAPSAPAQGGLLADVLKQGSGGAPMGASTPAATAAQPPQLAGLLGMLGTHDPIDAPSPVSSAPVPPTALHGLGKLAATVQAPPASPTPAPGDAMASAVGGQPSAPQQHSLISMIKAALG